MAKYRDVPRIEYEKLLGGSPFSEEQWERAFRIAHETRKFEIELYWKRSTYFWTFVAAAFAGYFALRPQADEFSSFVTIGRILLSALGMTFCYAWHLVSRASKFWQENWERHIDFLEDRLTGPLYKTIRTPHRDTFLFPFDAYPLSVSKINMLLSFLITLAWWIPLGMSISACKSNSDPATLIAFWILPGLWLGFLTLVFFVCGRTSICRSDSGDVPFITRSDSGY